MGHGLGGFTGGQRTTTGEKDPTIYTNIAPVNPTSFCTRGDNWNTQGKPCVLTTLPPCCLVSLSSSVPNKALFWDIWTLFSVLQTSD